MEDNLKLVVIPPGVVHAYKNIGKKPGLVLNFPNRLYAGWGKKENKWWWKPLKKRLEKENRGF